MEVKKIYRSKFYVSLTVIVAVGDKKITCEFTGGMTSPASINGSFKTRDAGVQKALESHPWFNGEFFLEKTITNGTPQQAEKKPAESQEKIISKATSANLAREELNKVYGVSFSKIKNMQNILAKAKELGIVYPDWEIK